MLEMDSMLAADLASNTTVVTSQSIAEPLTVDLFRGALSARAHMLNPPPPNWDIELQLL